MRDSPISRGCLCPKGSATFQLVTGSHREHHVLYRAPGGTDWQTIPLERAMEMVAERVQRTRDETWEDRDSEGHPLRRTLGIAHLGGATLDNEENYLLKKLYTALGSDSGRKPGPYLTLLHGPQFGDLFRKRRRDHVPAGSGELGLHRHRRAPTWPSATRWAFSG